MDNAFIVVLVFGTIYFIPSIVANQYEHRDTQAIFFTNLLLGWTFLGWAIALIWAMKKPATDK